MTTQDKLKIEVYDLGKKLDDLGKQAQEIQNQIAAKNAAIIELDATGHPRADWDEKKDE